MISFLLNGSWKVWDTLSFGPSLAADDEKLEFASSIVMVAWGRRCDVLLQVVQELC
jgi:hypothetical protein